MVKIKNVERKKSGRSRRSSSKKPQEGNSAAVVVAGFGWAFLVAAIVWTVMTSQRDKQDFASHSARLHKAVAELQASADEAKQEVMAKKKELQTQINAEIRKQEGLHTEVQGLKLAAKELEPQTAPLERTLKKLQEAVGAVKQDAGLAGEGLDELRKKFDKLEARKFKLVDEYKERYEKMAEQYQEKIDRPEPEQLRQFYTSHRHTPFAPAAGFYAAEKMYGAKRSQDALRYYQDVVKRYPDSPYADRARNRITDIEGRVPLKKDDDDVVRDFIPYHPKKKPEE